MPITLRSAGIALKNKENYPLTSFFNAPFISGSDLFPKKLEEGDSFNITVFLKDLDGLKDKQIHHFWFKDSKGKTYKKNLKNLKTFLK